MNVCNPAKADIRLNPLNSLLPTQSGRSIQK